MPCFEHVFDVLSTDPPWPVADDVQSDHMAVTQTCGPEALSIDLAEGEGQVFKHFGALANAVAKLYTTIPRNVVADVPDPLSTPDFEEAFRPEKSLHEVPPQIPSVSGTSCHVFDKWS